MILWRSKADLESIRHGDGGSAVSVHGIAKGQAPPVLLVKDGAVRRRGSPATAHALCVGLVHAVVDIGQASLVDEVGLQVRAVRVWVAQPMLWLLWLLVVLLVTIVMVVMIVVDMMQGVRRWRRGHADRVRLPGRLLCQELRHGLHPPVLAPSLDPLVAVLVHVTEVVPQLPVLLGHGRAAQFFRQEQVGELVDDGGVELVLVGLLIRRRPVS